jgi:hypothetical protein
MGELLPGAGRAAVGVLRADALQKVGEGVG